MHTFLRGGKSMSNIADYMDWRGDIPFSVDPFNEVDNLVLAALSYTDFTGVLEEGMNKGMLNIGVAADRFFALHTDEELMARECFTKMVPFLLRKIKGSRRFGSMMITDYINRYSVEREEQMSAVTFLLGDGTAYVSFRGTDDTVVGWKEDFQLAYLSGTAGQKSAVDYLSETGRRYICPLRVGGHSKGGNFAVYASAFCDGQVQDRILDVWSNDGPGFVREVLESEGYKAILPRIHSFIPEESVFGLLMHNAFSHTVVGSSEKGIMQHDSLSWQVRGSHFETLPRTSTNSELFEKTISGWVEGIDVDQRQDFVEKMFGLLESTGVESMHQFSGNPIRNATEIIKNYHGMEKDEQEMLKKTIGLLFASAGREVKEALEPVTSKPARLLSAVKETAKEMAGGTMGTVKQISTNRKEVKAMESLQYKGILMDMDGVIFDTENLYLDCWLELAQRRGMDKEDVREVVYRCIGVTSEESRKILLGHFGKDFPLEEALANVSAIFQQKTNHGTCIPVKKGVPEFLEAVKKSGIPVALASSTRTQIVVKELQAHGLLDYFTKVVGGDQVKRSKPSPDIFLKAAYELGLDSEDCLVIEDSANGVKAADRARCKILMVPDLVPPTEEILGLADAVVEDLTEAKRYLGM